MSAKPKVSQPMLNKSERRQSRRATGVRPLALGVDSASSICWRTDPSCASEAVIGQALGDDVWLSWPDELREIFEEESPAVMAEIRGVGLDLSARPFEFSAKVLADIPQPTMVVAAEDSPEVFRRIGTRLVESLAHAEELRLAGGHLIDPAHPEICAFIDRFVAR